MKVKIEVYLKNEILDPQGRAIFGALTRLNLIGLTDVRQGKQFILTFDQALMDSHLNEIRKIAETLLSNPVIENYSIEVLHES